MAVIEFGGDNIAALFTKELNDSIEGALTYNYVAQEQDGFPKGFLRASKKGNVWDDTCWTRDAGFARELAYYGFIEEAENAVSYLLDNVAENEDEFCVFPEFLKPGQKGAGYEIDGTANIVIAAMEVYRRSSDADLRSKIGNFLTNDASPIKFILHKLKSEPLIAGSGEFGGGWKVPGMHYNVVQNFLAREMTLKYAEFIRDTDRAESERCFAAANTLYENILKYLTYNGRFLWSIQPETLKPYPLKVPESQNTANINGIAPSVYDGEGINCLSGSPLLRDLIKNTLYSNLNSCKLRKKLFGKYGLVSFTDECRHYSEEYIGHTSWLSYCNCYAAQTAALIGEKEVLKKSVEFIALSTLYGGNMTKDDFKHRAEATAPKNAPLYFTERNFSPDWRGKRPPGCGFLNLVNVTEPMKLSRIMAGIDNKSGAGGAITISPRLPAGFNRVTVKEWRLSPDTLVDYEYNISQGKPKFDIHFTGEKIDYRPDFDF